MTKVVGVCHLLTGFSTEQSEAIVSVMVKTTNANMDTIYADMVTKTQQVNDCLMIHFLSLRGLLISVIIFIIII